MMPMFHAQPAPSQPQFPPPTSSMGLVAQPSHPPIVAYPGVQQPSPTQ